MNSTPTQQPRLLLRVRGGVLRGRALAVPNATSCGPANRPCKAVLSSGEKKKEQRAGRSPAALRGSHERTSETQQRCSVRSVDECGVSPGEFPPLRLGDLTIDPPLIVAPMAGITNAAFREMCYEEGAPLCASEMVTAGTLLQRHRVALKICEFGEAEPVRSAQLYGVQPEQVKVACKWLVEEAGAQHVDLNFGCPVRKVTAAGGGAAIPLHPRLLARLVSSAVGGAARTPVTVKMRMGISDDLLTFMEAGRIAEAEGAAAVTLHARTADMLYEPEARWDAIAELAHELSIPVIGNGDVFEAADAVRMLRSTGCAGVMIGRACLGRPWLLGQTAELLSSGQESLDTTEPCLAVAVAAAHSHCRRLASYWGSESTAARQMRKFVPLYLLGYTTARHTLQPLLLSARDLKEWQAAVDSCEYDPDERPSREALRIPRLKGAGQLKRRRVALPQGWLDDVDSHLPPTGPGADDACEG